MAVLSFIPSLNRHLSSLVVNYIGILIRHQNNSHKRSSMVGLRFGDGYWQMWKKISVLRLKLNI